MKDNPGFILKGGITMENNKKKEFTIHCSWTVTGEMKIVADTLEEAEKIAMGAETALPTDSYYLEDTFTLDKYVEDYGKYEEVK